MPKGVYLHKPASEETKLKMSLAHRGQPNAGHFANGMTPWNKGRAGYKAKPASEERKRKIGAANKLIRTGTHLSDITKQKLSERFRGANNHQWRGGRTSENHTIRRSLEYRVWRTHVFNRDNYTCQACGQCGGKLEADHELPFALYPDLRFEILNGRTLCVPCHKEVTKRQHQEGVFENAVLTRFKPKSYAGAA